MDFLAWIQFATALGVAVLSATLVEYVVHRLMHAGMAFTRVHAEHHAEGVGQGWFGECKDYLLPAIPFIWLGYLVSNPTGLGWGLGLLVYGALAAYAHQLQHERPDLCFWLRMPVHFIHHRDRMWHHNFGISVTLWDHVFGTYQRVSWTPDREGTPFRLVDLVRIKWF